MSILELLWAIKLMDPATQIQTLYEMLKEKGQKAVNNFLDEYGLSTDVNQALVTELVDVLKVQQSKSVPGFGRQNFSKSNTLIQDTQSKTNNVKELEIDKKNQKNLKSK